MTNIKILRLILLLTAFISFLPNVLAAHNIVGQVNDALDSTSVNGRIITLWNPANGISDNVTDIVGVTGNSGTNNIYLVDCETLDSPCQIGDTINAKIFNNGDSYVTETTSIVITGPGDDLMPTTTLNSPPTTSLNSPVSYANLSSNVIFNCSSSDLDANLANVTLYDNWSAGWHANETKTISGSISATTFSENLNEGVYSWNCLSQDNLSIAKYASTNRTFTVDLTAPSISSIQTNLSEPLCGTSHQARVTCNATDALTGIENVSIQAYSPSGINTSYNAQFVSPNSYYADISLNEVGQWQFKCSAYDYASNLDTKSTSLLIQSASPDLEIWSKNITFNNKLVESAPSTINVMVSNKGCSDADNFLVGFFNGQKETGTQIGTNQTVSIAAFSNASFSVIWSPVIGFTNIYVYADLNNIISESNETNNDANNTAFVSAWQQFYGNLSVTKILSNDAANSLSTWGNTSVYTGNIFVVDSDSNINWLYLQALGRDTSNATATNDFSDLDSLLNMTSFQDSVREVYTNNTDTPTLTDNFTVFRKTVANVPVAESVNNTNFYTGILWDYSKDHNGQYDTTDKEDVVFVTKANKQAQGTYGIYDYEIGIPAKLRNYLGPDTAKVNFYCDLM